MPDIVNPYIAGSPVTGPQMFFGREDVFDFICQTLIGQHRDNVIVLYGQRRTGKTSVLYQLHSHLGERYLCIFMDMHGFALEGLAGFLWELANHIVRILRRDYQIDLLRPNQAEFMADPRSFFENEFLNQVWSVIGDRHVLLMLDEAVRLQEQVQAGKLEHEIFSYMRHLMQHYERLNFLFSLGSGLEEMEKEYAFLFSVGLYKKISFLDRNAAEALITQPVKDHYSVEPTAIERIFHLTSGHPYYIQLLCHSLFNRWQQENILQIEVRNVDNILDEVIERGLSVLKHVWDESTAGEKAILTAMATAMDEHNAPVEMYTINKVWKRCEVVLPKGEMVRAIQSLIARDVITGQGAYTFTVDFQRLWVQKYRRLEWVKEELADAVQKWSQSPPSREKILSKRSPLPEKLFRFSWTKGTFLVVLVIASITFTFQALLPKLHTPSSSTGINAKTSASNLCPTATEASTFSVKGDCAYFVSSGQVNDQGNEGINDELQINLENVPAPAPGKNYYAWLLSDVEQTDSPTIFLGKLIVENGEIHFHYLGDPHHTNLLEVISRFLITEEDTSIIPDSPSLDQSTWRYYSLLPQTPDPADTVNHFSLLDHLRHLLAEDPKLFRLNLHGGLDIWLFRNTEKVLELADSARDSWENKDVAGIHNQVIRILDYLDGKIYVQTDVPPGTPLLVNSRIVSAALLEFDSQNQNPPGYLYHIIAHLESLIHSPGLTQFQLYLAEQIKFAIDNVITWLEQVHKDAKQLIGMSDEQLLFQTTLSLLDDLKTEAGNAYVGHLGPPSESQRGVAWIYSYMPYLATFDIKPYKS